MAAQHIDEAGYYHARAADMMVKAQGASSKAIRVAYFNLAWKWARKAATLEKEWQSPAAGRGEGAASACAGPKN